MRVVWPDDWGVLRVDLLFGTELIEALQAAFSPTLDSFFIVCTLLGGDYVYMTLLAVTFWCVDKRSGVRASYVLLASAFLNYWAKMAFRMDKPPPEYRIAMEEDVSYGFPSGHAQSAVTFWGWTGLEIRKAWASTLSVGLVVLIALSRIYLGVHYPGDVLGGLLVGVCLVLGARRAMPYLERKGGGVPRRLRGVLMPLMALLLFGLALAVFPDTTRGSPALVCGSLFGLSLGFFLESRYVQLSTAVDRRTKAIRAVTGLAAVVGLAAVTSLVSSWLSPSSPIYTDLLRYAVIGLAIAGGMPAVFRVIETRWARIRVEGCGPCHDAEQPFRTEDR